MKKLTAVVKHSRKNEVLEILESCAAYGIMVEDILGYGNQRGSSTKYRGVVQPVTCLSKVKFETVGDDETIRIKLVRTPLERSGFSFTSVYCNMQHNVLHSFQKSKVVS